MKKVLFLILMCLTFLSRVNCLEINSKNVILYNLDNNEILYEENSDEKIKIASLTKIMTTIVAIENIEDLNSKVTINNNMLKGLREQNASVAGFRVGDKLSYLDLLYAAMLPSAADATQALAISISGNVNNFVNLMNEKAIKLGMLNTNFTNTTGLDDKNNYSTLKDVAILIKYALKNDLFKTIFETPFYTTTNGKILIRSLDKNIDQHKLDINYIKGAKTGTTDLAGLCLASTTTYNNINYLLITTGALKSYKTPYNILDHDKIYKYYFENYLYHKVISKDDVLVNITNKYGEDIKILANEDIYKYLYKEDINNIKYNYEGLNKISIFNKEEIIGKLNINIDDDIITIDVYKPNNIDFNILTFISIHIYTILIPIILILLFIIGYLYDRKRVKQLSN